MADVRTAITELSTALGCLDHGTAGWAVLQRPPELLVPTDAWEQLERGLHDPALLRLAEAAFDNGAAFAAHADGLGGRRPTRIEWTGGTRPPGDQVIPADLRIDRVYLVSCKYLSSVLHNAAPARVFDGGLGPGGYDRADWFARTAPAEHRALAAAASGAVGCPFPADPEAATVQQRRRLRDALRELGRQWPEAAVGPYRDLCRAVSVASAARWRAAVPGRPAQELLLWRLLRLAASPYFVVGLGRDVVPLRLRIDTAWDWRQQFELRAFDIEPAEAGQPQVVWHAVVRDRLADAERTVDGHVEVRWSHGRFGGPPEAKVYLDTPHAQVPGYVPLS